MAMIAWQKPFWAEVNRLSYSHLISRRSLINSATDLRIALNVLKTICVLHQKLDEIFSVGNMRRYWKKSKKRLWSIMIFTNSEDALWNTPLVLLKDI
jgi:hypothetical protein